MSFKLVWWNHIRKTMRASTSGRGTVGRTARASQRMTAIHGKNIFNVSEHLQVPALEPLPGEGVWVKACWPWTGVIWGAQFCVGDQWHWRISECWFNPVKMLRGRWYTGDDDGRWSSRSLDTTLHIHFVRRDINMLCCPESINFIIWVSSAPETPLRKSHSSVWRSLK